MHPKPILISVVDDEIHVRKALDRLLRSVGFGVDTFASGAEFLDSLPQRRPDCVVLDLHLPNLSGLDVQQRLNQQNLNLPIIIMTGRDERGLRERALSAGAAAYLNKPLDERVLREAIALATSTGIKGETTSTAMPALSPISLPSEPPNAGADYEL